MELKFFRHLSLVCEHIHEPMELILRTGVTLGQMGTLYKIVTPICSEFRVLHLGRFTGNMVFSLFAGFLMAISVWVVNF